MKKSRTITNHNLAIQHNRLINSRHSLTLSEQKLFLAMVAQIQPEDKAFEIYKIDIKSFAEFTGNNHKEMYGQAKKITRSLLSKVIEIPLPNGDLLQTHFFGHAKYKNGEGYIEVSFYPELKPYLLELKKNFTVYDIRNVLPLDSKYAVRIYELLKQFRTIGERRIFISELMHLLAVPKSYSYGRFKKYILIPAQQSLEEHTDICFSFEEIKESRKVVQLRFILDAQDADFVERPNLKMEVITDDIEADNDPKDKDTPNPNPLYDILEKAITQKYGEGNFITWFEKAEINYEHEDIALYCPSQFHREWIEQRYAAYLQEIFTPTKVVFKVNQN